ncbi:MAG: radical SAM protein [Deltaproteobacteria bacterium]|jgi:nitrogen fixation protein NifB|nr:radical SAM protein [Deltaproteobacteria bacterium]
MSNDILNSHPCFSTHCQPTTGRIHLPVAPSCNIFCRFCSRGLTTKINRPGQAAKVLTPEQALGVVEAALLLCPELRVVGIAGPGDPLASAEALDTLILIKEKYPQLINCLSTNGLSLASSMERIMAAKIQTITVTVNAVKPVILESLNRGVLVKGSFIGGLSGASLLIEAQERGIRLAHENHLIIKVNTVLVPGINDGHIGEVAEKVKSWGADILNVIPLIPANELAHIQAPTDEDKKRADQEAGKYLPVKYNCRRCRADACGIPGVSEYSQELYKDLGEVETFSHG